MTEEYTVRFTSPGKDCDLCRTAGTIFDTDLDLIDCNVDIIPDSERNSISITGSWHAISQLRRRLVAVICIATEEKQAPLRDCVQSLVYKAIEMDDTETKEGTSKTNECTSTINDRSKGES